MSGSYGVGSGGYYPRDGSQSMPQSPSRMEEKRTPLPNSSSSRGAAASSSSSTIANTPNGMVHTPRSTNIAGGYPPRPRQHQAPHPHPPPAPRDGVLVPSENVGSKFIRAKETAESAHEAQLLKREDLHNALLQAVESRRHRAMAITGIHREEVAAVEAELRRLEQETLELEAVRRDICDEHKIKEVEHFKATKKRASTATSSPFSSSNGIVASSSLSSSLSGAGTLQQSYTLAQKQSPIRGQGTALMASLLYPTSSRYAQQQQSSSTLRGRFEESERELLQERLADADRVATELERECLSNEAKIEAGKRERDGLVEVLAVLREGLTDLERDAPDVGARLLDATTSLKLAGSHHNQLPELQRIVTDNQMTLHLLRRDFGEGTKMLMERIKADDGKIKELKQLDLGSSSSSSRNSNSAAAANMKSLLSSLVQAVAEENELLEGAMRLVVERADEQRGQLEGTVEMLKRRVNFLEGDLETTIATAAKEATLQRQHQQVSFPYGNNPTSTGGGGNYVNESGGGGGLNTTSLDIAAAGVEDSSPLPYPQDGGRSPRYAPPPTLPSSNNGVSAALLTYSQSPKHQHQMGGGGGGSVGVYRPLVAAPAAAAATAAARAPSSPSIGGTTNSSYTTTTAATTAAPYGNGLRGFGDKASAAGNVHRRLL